MFVLGLDYGLGFSSDIRLRQVALRYARRTKEKSRFTPSGNPALRSVTRRALRHNLQNVKKQCEFNYLTVFPISSVFHDLQDAPVLLKQLQS